MIPLALGVFSPTKDILKSNYLSSDKNDIIERLVHEISDLKTKYSNLESKLEQVESDAELTYLEVQGKFEALQIKVTELEDKTPSAMIQEVHDLVYSLVCFL